MSAKRAKALTRIARQWIRLADRPTGGAADRLKAEGLLKKAEEEVSRDRSDPVAGWKMPRAQQQ